MVEGLQERELLVKVGRGGGQWVYCNPCRDQRWRGLWGQTRGLTALGCVLVIV